MTPGTWLRPPIPGAWCIVASSEHAGTSPMMNDQEYRGPTARPATGNTAGDDTKTSASRDGNRYRGEVYSKRVPAGKRTYFFDIKTTRSGEDYFLTITESKRVDESRYEKHKIFLYKEDFGKFVSAMHEVVSFVREECLPGYEFRGLPEVVMNPEDETGQSPSR